MNNGNQQIQAQYTAPFMFEEILKRLDEQEVNFCCFARKHISGLDEFHVRGSEVSSELANITELGGFNVLDVGCGIGGPARMLAAEHNCMVTGIDISPDFIRTAKKLSAAFGLSKHTVFHQGDALELPFEDASFDIAWTQHAQMNVKDKNKFYSEISRVLRREGKFIYYDIFKKGNRKLTYPMPWADHSEISHLETTPLVDKMLTELGFSKLQSENQTRKASDYLDAAIAEISVKGAPAIGLNGLMGPNALEKLCNVRQGIRDGSIELQSGVFQKRPQYKKCQSQNNI